MRRRTLLSSGRLGSAALAGAALVACGQPAPSNAAPGTPSGAPAGAPTRAPSGTTVPGTVRGGKTALLELEKGGSVTVQLFADVAPKTVQNFEDKASKGFYNGLTFHRVEDWVVQGGDPLGTGSGGGQITTELNEKPFVVGALGVARGRDIRISNDAQFFICTKPADWLNREYTNFGQVLEGMETVHGIRVGDKIKRITIKS